MHVLRIEWIKPNHFRAFGESTPIVLEDQLTIFYGGNGTGKSSLAEAIEWLLFGYTTRRRKGDGLSKEEYRGTYARNIDECPADPSVEARILIGDGSSHLVKRTMLLPDSGRFDDTQSVLMIDETPGSFFDIGLSVSPVHNPVVTQHGIQDSIHTRPIERYRTLSDALGLTDLVALKDTLTSARILYRNDPPEILTRAFSETKGLPSCLQDLGLDAIAARWSDRDYQFEDDYGEIVSAACALTHRSVGDVESLVPILRKAQEKEMRRVFDISPFRPRADSDGLLAELHEQGKELGCRIDDFIEAVHALVESALTDSEQQCVQFWRAGVAILDKRAEEGDPQLCPFCEERTITVDLLARRRGQIERATGSLEAQKKLNKEAERCISTVAEAVEMMGHIRPKSPSEEEVAKLTRVFDESQETLELFLQGCTQFVSEASGIAEQLDSMERDIQSLKAMVKGPRVAKIPESARRLVQDFVVLIERFTEAFDDYRDAFLEFGPVLRVRLADESTVKKYTAAVKLLEARDTVAVCVAGKQLEDDLLECQRSVAEYVKQKQKEVLDARESDMLSWYERLSPGATTAFSGIEPATDRFILKAECFDTELSAPACLSQSQLNCLGLSIWIPNVTSPLSPFRFLIFDDPVQAMDDDHIESFIIKVVPHLIEREGVQVVVLTHLKPLADRLRDEHYHLNPQYYRFDNLAPDGVQLSEYYPVSDEIRRIKRRMKSASESMRMVAVDRIRVLCEHVMREACLREHGCPLPEEYAIATASELLKPFGKLANVGPKTVQGVTATVKWSDPAHHTDKTWQVPSMSNIQPHISRLENFAKELGLVQ